jgi:hypothetical protein
MIFNDMIYIKNKKSKVENLQKKFPKALILDVSSKGEQPWVQLSPFYPHGQIPIPPYQKDVKPEYFSQTVEGIWQGLKVFEGEDIDTSKFEITNMEGIKRTVRKFGKPLGHRYGIGSSQLLDYPTARKEIYLRAYAWVLDNKVSDIILKLKKLAEKQDLILLDYNTNEDIENYKQPISHAGLVKRYLLKKYPELETLIFEQPKEEKKKKSSTKKATSKPKSKKFKNTDNTPDLFNSQHPK